MKKLVSSFNRAKNKLLRVGTFLTQKADAATKNQLVKEFGGIVLSSLALMLLLSFISYNTQDYALGPEQETNNWLGPLGATAAHTLLGALGLLATVLPLMAFLLAGRWFFNNEQILRLGRSIGFLLAMLGLAPIFSYFWPALGGTLGIKEGALLRGYLSSFGMWIVGLTLCACSLLLILNKPYVRHCLEKLFEGLNKLKASISLPKKPLLAIKKPVVEPKSPLINEPIFSDVEGVSAVSFIKEPVVSPLVSPFVPMQAPSFPKEEAIQAIVMKEPTYDSGIHIIERDREKELHALEIVEKDHKKNTVFNLPPLNLLDFDAPPPVQIDPAHFKKEAERLQRAFLQFGIEGKIREIRPGPVVTNYEFVPAAGIKLSRIAALSDDIAMAMSAVHVRIVTPIPGKGAVGIEVPNEKREVVYLKEIVADEVYRAQSHKLCMAIGKDVEGTPYFMNLADMPHVLIAGTTGSGKSVSVNAMICSILYRATPEDVRFLMIDPKMLELSIYNGIPHLLLPPIIDAKKAANALKWAVKEMDQRYELMKEAAVRDITTYNEKIKTYPIEELKEPAGRKHEHLPFIVIVVDEYADLLAVAGKEVEGYIMRLAQKARAAGIHVMLATQRPSVDVITGVIKANFPVRMGFRLASNHDSKTIINRSGAEKLLGKGDVLIMPPGTSDVFRIHGAFISEKELSRVVAFLQEQKAPDYREEIADFDDNAVNATEFDKSDVDEKFSEAIAIVKEHNKCSTSFLQRHLCVGYNRAARIVEQMEKAGMVGPVLNAKGEREIFVD